MSTCTQTNIPELNLLEDPCEGVKKSTNCVIQATAIPPLNLPPNSTQTQINSALVLALQSALLRIEQLENPV